MKKIIILSGKGGVGKTTISAATAVKISEMVDDNIMVVSFDIAHNLSDIFGKKIGDKETQITDNLWAIEPDPEHYVQAYTKRAFDLFRESIFDLVLPRMMPSLKNLFETLMRPENLPLQAKTSAFFHVFLNEQDKYEYILGDFPPTGSTLNLFEVPMFFMDDLMKFAMSFKTPLVLTYEGIRRILNPTKLFSATSPFQQLINEVKKIQGYVDRVNKTLKEHLSLRLVTIPEKAAVNETIRSIDDLRKFYEVDAIYINKIIEHADSPFLKEVQKNQQQRIKEIEAALPNKPIWKIPQLPHEPIDLDGLREIANQIYPNFTLDQILTPQR